MPQELICITSRMGSSRLPGKALMDVVGKPLLHRVYERVTQGPEASPAIICTDRHSPEIVEYCHRANIPCMQGHAEDVIARMLLAAREVGGIDTIVRVTGDNPLTCPALICGLMGVHWALNADYTYPYAYPHIPRGVRSEVIKYRALRELHQMLGAVTHDDISGVFMMLDHTVGVDCNFDTDARFTVDTADELEVVREVYRSFGGDPPGIPELITWWNAYRGELRASRAGEAEEPVARTRRGEGPANEFLGRVK